MEQPNPRQAVLTLALGVFMSSLDLFIVNLAFPSISRGFHVSGLGELSWVLNGYTIVFAATLVPAGRWADRIGRRRSYVAGLTVFSLASAACGVAPGVGFLVAARVVQAVGAGVMVPASLSLLLAVVAPARRPEAIGTWSALGALGAAFGPVVGGLLVQLDWRLVFWVNLPVGAATAALALRALPESRDAAATRRPDLVGAAMLAAGVGLVAWALVEAPSWGWGSGRFVAVVVAALVVAGAVVVRCARHAAPVIDLVLLRSRSFDGALVASILYYAGFAAFLLNTVEFLTGVWHYSPIRAGLAIAPGPLTVLPFARMVAPRLAARLGGPGRVAVIGCAVNAAAQAVWLAGIQVHPAYAGHLLPAQLIGGMGVGLTIPSLLGAGSASLPPARFGAGSGVLNMGRQVGSVLGVAGLVAILARLAPGDPLATFRTAIVMIIGFFAAAAVLSLAVLARKTDPRAPALPAPALINPASPPGLVPPAVQP